MIFSFLYNYYYTSLKCIVLNIIIGKIDDLLCFYHRESYAVAHFRIVVSVYLILLHMPLYI